MESSNSELEIKSRRPEPRLESVNILCQTSAPTKHLLGCADKSGWLTQIKINSIATKLLALFLLCDLSSKKVFTWRILFEVFHIHIVLQAEEAVMCYAKAIFAFSVPSWHKVL